MLSSLGLNLLLTTAALTTTAISATTLPPNIANIPILHASDVLSKPYAALLPPRLLSSSPSALLARQQQTTNSTLASDVQLTSNGTLNSTAWSTATGAACVARLSALARSSNPSGACICYNLPALDVDSGVFEVDLRLYRVSDPRDSFAGISPGDIQVGVAYTGANVSLMNSGSGSGSGAGSSSGSAVNITKRADSDTYSDGPALLQSYMLVGQINSAQMQKNLSLAQLQAILIPTLTLTATTSTGGRITTNVSLNEASFLTGVFSKSVVMSDTALAQAAVNAQLAALQNGTVAFVLPGTQLMVFPIGLVITSSWLLLGVVAYGFGTYERIQYADMYKRRVSRAAK